MSNNGSALQSCGPSTNVTNGNTSTQVGINYDADGMPTYTVVDGIQTLFSRDSDERVTAQTFQPIPSGSPYGNLTYQYDRDGNMVDEGGSLAAINMPQNETETFSNTDQVITWNGYPVSSDTGQSNLTADPSNGLSYTWDARNQLASISGGLSEAYDPPARRLNSVSATDNLAIAYDKSAITGWLDIVSGSAWSFLGAGGAALAGSYTSGGTTTTWVPLIDGNGSTIALVNPASPSAPATTYTYDPSGNVTVTGTPNSWPFEFAGMEHEITDPANLYFLPGSNVYNPQLQIDLSQGGPQGLAGPGLGPSGSPAAAPGGSSGGGAGAYFNAGNIAEQDAISVGIQNAVTNGVSELATLIVSETLSAAAGPIGLAASAIYDLFTIFDDLFGGGGSPPIPRQLMHRRHPLYGQIIGIDSGLIPTEGSASPLVEGLALGGSADVTTVPAAESGAPSVMPPLRNADYSGRIILVGENIAAPEYRNAPPPPVPATTTYGGCLAGEYGYTRALGFCVGCVGGILTCESIAGCAVAAGACAVCLAPTARCIQKPREVPALKH